MTGMQFFFFFSFFGGWGWRGCNSVVVEKREDQKRKCKLRRDFFFSQSRALQEEAFDTHPAADVTVCETPRSSEDRDNH